MAQSDARVRSVHDLLFRRHIQFTAFAYHESPLSKLFFCRARAHVRSLSSSRLLGAPIKPNPTDGSYNQTTKCLCCNLASLFFCLSVANVLPTDTNKRLRYENDRNEQQNNTLAKRKEKCNRFPWKRIVSSRLNIVHWLEIDIDVYVVTIVTPHARASMFNRLLPFFRLAVVVQAHFSCSHFVDVNSIFCSCAFPLLMKPFSHASAFTWIICKMVAFCRFGIFVTIQLPESHICDGFFLFLSPAGDSQSIYWGNVR